MVEIVETDCPLIDLQGLNLFGKERTLVGGADTQDFLEGRGKVGAELWVRLQFGSEMPPEDLHVEGLDPSL